MNQISTIRPAKTAQAERILIVDDSLVTRSIIEKIVEPVPGLQIAGTASTASQALEFLKRNSADIIILDIEMPMRSGLDALPDILTLAPQAKILVLSTLCEAGAPAVIKALSLGACDTLAKPGPRSYTTVFARELLNRLEALSAPGGSAALRPVAPPEPTRPESRPPQPRPLKHSALSCLAIGSSTGGITGIHEVLNALDSRIDCPILITQHLPVSFMAYLARQLDELGSRHVVVATDGAALERNTVYLAPGDRHLSCVNRDGIARVALTLDWDRNRYLPSVDPMFLGVARCFGSASAAIVLSGMGNDGMIGAAELADRGAPVYAQSPESSVVWGMPGAVAKAGLTSAVLPPQEIAQLINEIWLDVCP